MLRNKICFILFASLFVTALAGCGGAGNIDSSSSSSTLTAISITPVTSAIAANTGQQFIATGIYSDNTTRDITASVTWTSSDTAVATVDNSTNAANGVLASLLPGVQIIYKAGHVTGKTVGRTTITARWGSRSGWSTLSVTPATLVSIAVTPTNPSIAKGTAQQCTATGTFTDNTTQDLTASVTWSSSNTGVATVSNGSAAAVAPGSTTITAASGSITGSTTLSVTPATLVSIEVTPTNPGIAKGTAVQFRATGVYSDNTTHDLTPAVTWGSSNMGAATISNSPGSNGLASSVAAGSTTITASSGNIAGSTSLAVTPATLVSLAVTPANPSIANGTTRQFTAMGTYSDGTTQDLTIVAVWSSSSTAVAAISNAAGSNGLATSLATGSSTITAAAGNISGATTLTVTPATLVSLAVTPANPSIAKGTAKQFTATGTYTDNTKQNVTAAVTWSSSAASVAAISNAAGSNGLAASVSTGSTTITAITGSITASATLTVTPATLVSIAVTPASAGMTQGATQQFKATGTFSDSTTQDLTAASTWSSSSPGVVTISNAAGSYGLATAVAAGTATITATSGGVSAAAALTVTAITTGSATLSWDAPTTNTDGTPLTDLAGYKVYMGTSSGNYTTVVDIGNVMTYVVNNLAPGTYFFAVTAYDSSNSESSFSNEASKTI